MNTICQSRLLIAAVCFTILSPLPSCAQLFVQWQVTLGGADYEECTALQVTDDGGCVVTGGSISNPSGNKTAPNYSLADFWLVKLDADGTPEWDHTYGGSGAEYANGLQITPDGGYLLSGWSRSGANGNKTSDNIGFRDYWLVKTDADGNKQWERGFGGERNDSCWHLASAPDGYLLTGATFSDASGNKTSPLIGGDDGWVVKVDTNGLKQWDMAYGGTNNDYLYWAEPTTDGGFILAGESESVPSGNKTSPNYGLYDGWVIKIDGSGNKMWETALGGTDQDFLTFVYVTTDGGCFVGAGSQSEPSGNKTSPSYGAMDWWLVKLDSDGNMEWDQSYGGAQNDFLKGVLPYDGGYLLYGTSWSDVSGNKTTPKFGESDYWLVKVDSMGNKQWEQVIGGFGEDNAVEAFMATSDGGFLLGGYSELGGNGNKTVTSFGDFDYWIVKLVPPPTLTIAPAGPAQATISWSPDAPGFLLQETSIVNPPNWLNSASSTNNPVTVPVPGISRFYRLHKP